jgi:hypothetical protein
MRGASRQLKRSLASYFLSFAGLVALAKSLNPIPSRTRPLNSSAPMVLWLKPWESRSLPGLPRTRKPPLSMFEYENAASLSGGGVFVCALATRMPCISSRRAALAIGFARWDRPPIFTAQHGERALVHLRHQRVLLPAQRAIAGRDLGDFCHQPERHSAAMAGASIDRHAGLSWSLAEHRRDRPAAPQMDCTQNNVW